MMRRKRTSAGPRASSRRTAPPKTEESTPRLQKALAQLGLASRREAEDWIRAGRLSVNGAVASLGMRVHPEDQIRLDGRLVRQRAPAPEQAFVCHRSPGEALARPDESLRDPLIARLPRTAGRRFIAVSPMPRIDGGLELVTSDGQLAARLQRAIRLLSADFSVRVLGELTEQQLESLHAGVLDHGEPLTVLACEAAGGEGANRWYSLSARGASGKDVRQLFERQGARVGRVLRTRLGPLVLDRAIGRGQFRRLGAGELAGLLNAANEASSPH